MLVNVLQNFHRIENANAFVYCAGVAKNSSSIRLNWIVVRIHMTADQSAVAGIQEQFFAAGLLPALKDLLSSIAIAV